MFSHPSSTNGTNNGHATEINSYDLFLGDAIKALLYDLDDMVVCVPITPIIFVVVRVIAKDMLELITP